jgi:cell division protein FtsQ
MMDTSNAYVLKKSRKRIWWIVVAASAAIAGFAIWVVWFSTLFSVDQVRVIQVDQSTQNILSSSQVQEVTEAAGIFAGEPIASVDTDSAATDVATLPWVKSVEVRRGWPDEIVIAIEPRVPIGKVQLSGQELGVDGFGIIFDYAETGSLVAFDAQGEALVAAVTVHESLPTDLKSRVRKVAATSRDNVELTLKSGSLVRWGSAEELEFKSQVLQALLTRRAEIYDVSAPELPTTVNEKGRKKS